MENKKTKYLLGLMLALVWGLVGYRLYNKYFSKDTDSYTIPTQPYEEKESKGQDTFALMLSYADPFLYDEIVREERPPSPSLSTPLYSYPSVSIEPAKPSVTVPPPPPPPPIIFPDISYQGNIKMQTGRIVALVNISGSFFNWGLKETYKDLTLLGVYEDSIQVQYKGATKTYLKIR